ncbi:hypothetical protein PQR46_32115 [Paraburkholderia sediminicola]|uniref:hypothetical protein n=1 Tax=Paraburkholderia sediminicola TaxID=458836 RepID=UPI0038B89289
MNNRTAVVGLLCVGLFATAAHAQQPPTNIDLTAAYCIGVVQQNFTLIPTDLNRPEVTDPIRKSLQEQLNHLQAYLLPRMQYVDPVGITAARARGQTDAKAVVGAEMMACTSRCTTPPNVDATTAMKQCALSCDTEHRLPRVWSCHDLSWLPF